MLFRSPALRITQPLCPLLLPLLLPICEFRFPPIAELSFGRVKLQVLGGEALDGDRGRDGEDLAVRGGKESVGRVDLRETVRWVRRRGGSFCELLGKELTLRRVEGARTL